MSKDVCLYCGKANGWHAWACPSLEFSFSLERPAAFLTRAEDPDSVKVIDTTVLQTEPEVE